ncbi:MAG: O-acetyl-ADP-ribose deacetylase [Phaeodactylibacter sp.]|nr:O-acetyl-ADP-ribose deacetylase [Phaeodactylibacter sp.]MCB9291784.1 O-acetyl-ADP-ribose deacetylase [Lewinellaceae bacterium]
MEKIKLIRGDITKMEVDAVVNAANSSLMGGSGVDGAIHRAGGPEILEECRQIRAECGKCPTGQAVITTAGKMPSRKVVHTVGPIWGQQSESESDRLLADCYRNSLSLAVKNGLKRIAFPNISTGVYGFPKERAASVATRAVKDFLSGDASIEQVCFVCFDDENYRLYEALLQNNQ